MIFWVAVDAFIALMKLATGTNWLRDWVYPWRLAELALLFYLHEVYVTFWRDLVSLIIIFTFDILYSNLNGDVLLCQKK